MSDVTELRFWPCCNDAIDWSHDGIMALASEENVELLFPNTEYYDKEQGSTSWQHTPLQVPWFTKEELPPKEPAPFRNLSVGEEVSPSLPMGVSWSAPGLAKHRRCALGTLTSSLVFSIWAADGKPNEESSWRRRLIVNDSLAKYFISNAMQEKSVLVSRKKEKLRLRSRVRCFAWAPNLPNAQTSGIIGTQLTWGQHIVATANDDNQVIVVLVNSPTTTLGVDEEWSAKVLNHFLVMPDSDNIFPETPTTLDEIMQQQRFISHVTWSPWTVRGDRYHSVLAYSTNENVRARIIAYTHGTVEFGEEVIFAKIDLRNNGAMKWSPVVIDGHKLTLAMFAHTGVTCLTVSATDASILSRSSDNLDHCWDETSGIVWDHPPHSLAQLHFSSFRTTLSSASSTVEVAEDGSLTVLPSPNWREQINDSRALFSVQNELKGHVKSKVWGLCASPLKDFIATCHTLHPSDMIEYGPPAARRSTIAINGLQSFNRPDINFPAGNASAETVMFTIRKWLDKKVEDAEQISEFTDQVLPKLIQVYGPADTPNGPNDTVRYEFSDLPQLIQEFKRNALLDPQSVKDRYTILISRTCTAESTNDLQRTLIAYRLAAATQNLPTSISLATPFSSEILSSHQQVITLINILMESSAITEDDSSGPPVSIDVGIDVDICDFCNAPIPFTDLNRAACINGHQFSRCGLSFLAIQAPRITKTCGICDTPFLSEEFVAAQERESKLGSWTRSRDVEMEDAGGGGEREGSRNGEAGDNREGNNEDAMDVEGRENMSAQLERDGDGYAERGNRVFPVSLARVLFLACDVCIYCGGKFTG